MSRARRAARWLILAVVVSWATAASAANPSKTLSVGSASVALDWSPDWQVDPDTAALPAESTAFSTADATKMRTLLSTGPMRPEISTDEGMRAVASDMAVQLESQSVEKKIEVQRVASEHAHGYYVCATDRAPKPGEYKYMCQGLLSVDGTPIVFTVLYNDSGKSEAAKVVAAMKTLQISTKT
jgi:hypothetical protein